MRAKDAIGRYGEQVAVRHLEERGFAVLDRNWRCAEGELDVVAIEQDVLVFCEVKTRSSLAFGAPAEAVHPAKASRIRRLALRWLESHAIPHSELRFDVVSVLKQPQGAAQIQHLRGAF